MSGRDWYVPVGTVFQDPAPDRHLDRGLSCVVTWAEPGRTQYMEVTRGVSAGRREMDMALAARLVVERSGAAVVRPAREWRVGTVLAETGVTSECVYRKFAGGWSRLGREWGGRMPVVTDAQLTTSVEEGTLEVLRGGYVGEGEPA